MGSSRDGEIELATIHTPHKIDGRFECSAGDVLHIQQPTTTILAYPLIVNPDDVRMIQLGQRLWLVPLVGRYFQGDQALQRLLPGQVNRGKRARAKLCQQVEIVDLLARIEFGRTP